MCITADFWKLKTIADYRSTIADKLENLDVAVLALNAGYVRPGPFAELTDFEVEM